MATIALLCSSWLAVHRALPGCSRVLRLSSARPGVAQIVASDVNVDVADGSLDGRKRRALRALAGRMHTEGTLKVINVLGVDFTSEFLSKIDRALDEEELIKLRLRDVGTKKEVKIVAEDIATRRGAHVAQVVGHTALLYRERGSDIGPPRVIFDDDYKSARVERPLSAVESNEVKALDAVFADREE